LKKIYVEQTEMLSFFVDDKSPLLLQLKDILITHLWINFNLGYVQGMNDILVPIITLMNNEYESFWCFVGKMKMMENLFLKHQPGVQELLKKLIIWIERIDPYFYKYLRSMQGTNFFFVFDGFYFILRESFLLVI